MFQASWVHLPQAIHLLIRDLTLSFPVLKVTYSHVESAKNCSDANSKICDDPVSIINSDAWRHGHNYFFSPDHPLASDTFLTVASGVPQWTPPAHEHLCAKCSIPCPCARVPGVLSTLRTQQTQTNS